MAPSVLRLEHDVAELLGRLQARLRGDGRVELLARDGRLRAELAGRDLDVLRLDRACCTSAGVRLKLFSLNGSSQMRMA